MCEETRKYVGNTCPRCIDVCSFVSHMRDDNVLSSCLDVCDRSYSFKLMNILYLLMSYGSFVVPGSLFDLLADVSHLDLLLSVHLSERGLLFGYILKGVFFFCRWELRARGLGRRCCRHSRTLLLCFTSLFFKYFRLLNCYGRRRRRVRLLK